MNELVNTQTLLFIKCAEIGILMGMIYDLIRIFRKLIKHFDWMVQIEDGIYWICCSFIGFGILYMHNYAEIRFFSIIGMILGGVLYLSTFSILFMNIATWVIKWLKKIISYIIHIISMPVKWLLHLIKMPIRWVGIRLGLANNLRKMKVRKLKRKWYYKKADIRAELKQRKHK